MTNYEKKQKQLAKAGTISEIEKITGLVCKYSISHRGGSLGFDWQNFKIGAWCNYLGGGVRGTINISQIPATEPEPLRSFLTALAEACGRVYLAEENAMHLNDLEDEDGDTNWEALATEQARKAGTVSAY